AGNAFFLEELIRAVAEGARGDALPPTVLAMVQARLEELEPGARRVLRAASVFGDVFWRGGVRALVGEDDADLDAWIEHLVAHEVVARRLPSQLRDEQELAFRHALWREAAYATLTEADRRLGHLLAARWLRAAAAPAPLVLAEHFDRGGEAG